MTPDTRERVAEIGVEGCHGSRAGCERDPALRCGTGRTRPGDGNRRCLRIVGELPTFTEGDSIAWRTYERGEVLALDDVHEDPDVYNSRDTDQK